MAWSWNHTQEAYDTARENLRNRDREWLRECFCEWKADEFDEAAYKIAMLQAVDLPNDILADAIWERMEEAACCDNGGFNAWACPTGCHTVSFGGEVMA